MSIAIWRHFEQHLDAIERRALLLSAVPPKNDVPYRNLSSLKTAGSILMTVDSIVLSEEFLRTESFN